MFDVLGAMRLRVREPGLVVLSLHPSARAIGLVGAGVGGWLALSQWGSWLAMLPGIIVGVLSLLIGTLVREIEFDRADGVLRLREGTLGRIRRERVPLFHIRAVVVRAKRPAKGKVSGAVASKYVFFVEKRVGGTIYLDESRHTARLLAMAEAITDETGVRLEYDATQQMAQTR